MRNPVPALCSIDWCIRDSRANGFCPAHYKRDKNGTNMDAPLDDIGCCEVPRCYRSKVSSHYCQMHYRREVKGADLSRPSQAIGQICDVDGCYRGVKARNLCPSHYSRYKSGAEVYTPLAKSNKIHLDECVITNCKERPIAKDLCKRHTTQRLTYKISTEDIEYLSQLPCMICGGEGGHTDHDSSCCATGNYKKCGRCVRGTLCHGCNIALGMMRDDPVRLRKAADYLSSWERDASIYRTI